MTSTSGPSPRVSLPSPLTSSSASTKTATPAGAGFRRGRGRSEVSRRSGLHVLRSHSGLEKRKILAKSSRTSRSSGSGGSRRIYLIVGAVIVLFVAGFIALAVLAARQQSGAGAPDDVKTYDLGPAGKPTEGEVDYAQTPPVGGAHKPVWPNCGFYDEPIRDENAVHSLEHGAVWITYSPDLPQDQVDELRGIAE